MRGVRMTGLSIVLMSLFGCNVKNANQTSKLAEGPFQNLSETGLYDNILQKQIKAENALFTPAFPLWTDGAEKQRWIYLPPGTQINSSDMDRWVFPVGTRFWKEFSFRGKRVETRMSEKIADAASMASWKFYTYRWNDDETEATLVGPAGVKDVAYTGLLPDGEAANPVETGTMHDIPGSALCTRCHNKGGDAVLGFNAMQLSERHAGYAASGTTMADLVMKNLLTVAPSSTLEIPSADPNVVGALGYLHGNCGGCHNPQSAAGMSTGLFLQLSSSAATLMSEPVYQTGVQQLSSSFEVPGTTLGTDSFRIAAGHPELSALFIRATARGGFPQMPPVGSEVVDKHAKQLLTDWILGLQ